MTKNVIIPDHEVGDINWDNSINTTILILENDYNLIIIVKYQNVNNLVQFIEDFLNNGCVIANCDLAFC
jgi:hypothetical protein